ncbi:hypothetical protein HYH03_006085 [Edaphochlamys debaryana]|uniref:Uncharacterized protein n=1 Tax=Edaphochlamys debaryana TaxID=47281 RepID=A0A835Y7X8_9CHLO|nr:hypothetical protein HYH03_006085 [Edaphochlamys debaryana]|eukprot:KAG2495846.1 hypothetical protein HYH03_006085 [Edaphochlamys debaryana]
MFSLLSLHEEREPRRVAATQSKRAQRRLARREETINRLESSTTSVSEDERPSRSQDPERLAAALYDELLGGAQEFDASILEDIAAQVQRVSLSQARRADATPPAAGSPGRAGLACDQPLVAGWGLRGASGASTASSSSPRSTSAAGASQLAHASPWAAHGGGSVDGSTAAAKLRALAAQDRTRDRLGLPLHRQLAGQQPRAQGGPKNIYKQLVHEEEYPELPAAAAPAKAATGNTWGHVGGRRQPRTGSSGHSHLHVRGRHGAHGGAGIKVLNTAHDVARTGAPHASSGAAGGDGLNLPLLWDLLDGGMSLLADPLADDTLSGPSPEAQAAIRRLAAAQIEAAEAAEGGPARGVSQEDMIAMMARAASRQRPKGSSSRRRGGIGGDGEADAGDRDGQRRGRVGRERDADADGGSEYGGSGSGSSSSSEDESHFYPICDAVRDWRHTRLWMERHDWVRVTDTSGKHHKYRRLLPNGQIQTQTVCCSSSDAIRGIRNLQADLARKDAEANEVIRQWRSQQRERKRAERAAAAAAAAAMEP